jgi:hypothetical protein
MTVADAAIVAWDTKYHYNHWRPYTGIHNADADGNWAVSVPVYQAEDCGNPSGELAIVGFARVIITGVEASPEHTIYGTVECDYVDPENSRGGGNYYGTKGSIPGLVE